MTILLSSIGARNLMLIAPNGDQHYLPGTITATGEESPAMPWRTFSLDLSSVVPLELGTWDVRTTDRFYQAVLDDDYEPAIANQLIGTFEVIPDPTARFGSVSTQSFTGTHTAQMGEQTITLTTGASQFGADNTSQIRADGTVQLSVNREPTISWPTPVTVRITMALPWGWRFITPKTGGPVTWEPHSTGNAHADVGDAGNFIYEGYSGSSESTPSVVTIQNATSFRLDNSSNNGGGNIALITQIEQV